jgi:hypothetical protein
VNIGALALAPHWQPSLFALLAPHVMATDEPAPPSVSSSLSSSSSSSAELSAEGYPTAQDPNTSEVRVRVSYLSELEGVATYTPKDTPGKSSTKDGARGRTAQDFAAEFGGQVDDAMKSRSDAVRWRTGGE